MYYTEEDLRNAFNAGNDAQYEDEFNLTLKEEEDKFIKELNEVKKLTISVVSVPLCRYTNCTKEADGDGEMWCTYHDLQING